MASLYFRSPPCPKKHSESRMHIESASDRQTAFFGPCLRMGGCTSTIPLCVRMHCLVLIPAKVLVVFCRNHPVLSHSIIIIGLPFVFFLGTSILPSITVLKFLSNDSPLSTCPVQFLCLFSEGSANRSLRRKVGLNSNQTQIRLLISYKKQ